MSQYTVSEPKSDWNLITIRRVVYLVRHLFPKVLLKLLYTFT